MIPEEYFWIKPFLFLFSISLGSMLYFSCHLLKKYIKETQQTSINFKNFIKKEYFPKKLGIHIMNGSWEDQFDDPFEGFAVISNCVEIGEVLTYNSGSWKYIYWQKYCENDYICSEDFHVSVGGDLKRFKEWSKDNEHLLLKNKLND